MPTSNSASNGFKIFCDEDPGIQSSLPPSTGEWQMPPTEPVIKRENTQKPGKWTDAKVQPQEDIFLCIHLHTCTVVLTYLHVQANTLQFANNLCLVLTCTHVRLFGLQYIHKTIIVVHVDGSSLVMILATQTE